MSKILLLAIALAITGCATNAKKDERTWTHLQCSGASVDWKDCWNAAKAFCPNGFDMANKQEQRESLKREVDVACK